MSADRPIPRAVHWVREGRELRWTHHLHDGLRIVETVYTGQQPGTTQELQTAAESSLKLAAERGHHLFLSDCSGVTGGSSILPAYEVGDFYSRLPLPRNLREAIVLPRDEAAAAGLRFYETTVRNRGFAVRAFADRNQALEWLVSNRPAAD